MYRVMIEICEEHQKHGRRQEDHGSLYARRLLNTDKMWMVRMKPMYVGSIGGLLLFI